MSNMEELFAGESLLIEDTERDNSKDKATWTPMGSGEYLGWVTEVEERIVDVKQTYKAKVFNYKFQIAPENKLLTYHIPQSAEYGGGTKEVNGSVYVGKTLKASGIFKFLEPNLEKGDPFQSNPQGNRSYSILCKTLGLEVKEEEREVNGEKKKYKILPDIKKEHLEGFPATAVVGPGKPWTNSSGEKRRSWEVKFIKKWEGGTKMEDKTDVPF